MSEPIQGLPVPGSQPSGIAPTPGQPPTPAPNPALAQPTGAPPVAPTPTPPGPDLATVQRERDQAVAHARQMQSQKDQAEARMRAMAGIASPPPDPMDAKVAAYSKQFDLHPDDTRKFLSMLQAETAPLAQRNQHLEAQMQGGTIAQQAMQAAISANPELFADPAIQNDVWNSMQQTAQQGNLQILTPDYAKYLGAQAWAIKNEPWKNPNPQPPAPQPMPGFRPALPPISFNGGPGNYPPPPVQPSNVPNAQVAALAAQMAAYTGIPLAQQ